MHGVLKLISSQTKGATKKMQVAQLIDEKWMELSEIYHTIKGSIRDSIVQYLPFKYNVTFGHKPFIHYHKPSFYAMDF